MIDNGDGRTGQHGSAHLADQEQLGVPNLRQLGAVHRDQGGVEQNRHSRPQGVPSGARWTHQLRLDVHRGRRIRPAGPRRE